MSTISSRLHLYEELLRGSVRVRSDTALRGDLRARPQLEGMSAALRRLHPKMQSVAIGMSETRWSSPTHRCPGQRGMRADQAIRETIERIASIGHPRREVNTFVHVALARRQGGRPITHFSFPPSSRPIKADERKNSIAAKCGDPSALFERRHGGQTRKETRSKACPT